MNFIKHFVPNLFVAVCLLIEGCTITSPVENVKVIFNAKPVSTIISGNIVDAATGEPIRTQTVTVTIQGENRSAVTDLTSSPKTVFTTNSGFLNFALTEDVLPTVTSPVKINLIAECTGYISTNLPLQIVQTGSAIFTIRMVNSGSLPAGTVKTTSTGTADNSGSLQDAINIAGNEPAAGIDFSLSMPKGLKLYSANNTPLKGNLTASVIYFNSKNEESLRAFPGGFAVTTNENGSVSQGAFFTAGLFQVSVKDAYGNEAAKFNTTEGLLKKTNDDTLNPLMTVELAQGTNPETGAQIQAGDSIGIWSLNNSSALWNLENKVVIKGPNSDGKFFVQFRTNHFSTWNLDWKGSICYKGIKINITGKPYGYPIVLVMTGLSGYFHNEIQFSDNFVQIVNAPAGQPVKITAYDGKQCSGAAIGSITVSDLCSGEATLNVNLTPPPAVTFKIKAEGYCKCDTTIRFRPNGNPVWYRPDELCNSNWVYAGLITDGYIVIPEIAIGTRYIYSTWYEGEWYTIGATVYGNYAEIDNGLASSNIVYSQVTKEGDNFQLYFMGQLSSNICKDICK